MYGTIPYQPPISIYYRAFSDQEDLFDTQIQSGFDFESYCKKPHQFFNGDEHDVNWYDANDEAILYSCAVVEVYDLNTLKNINKFKKQRKESLQENDEYLRTKFNLSEESFQPYETRLG